MSDSKISSAEQWFSKVFPPEDRPSVEPDLLAAIEPVHASESGALEEVQYDVTAISDIDLADDSLERSARKFGTHVPVAKAKRKMQTGELKDKLTRFNARLHVHIRKLVEQKRIKVPSYCGIHLSEYILRNRDRFPYLKQKVLETVKDDISKKGFSTHRYGATYSARDNTVTSVISVPLFFLLNIKEQEKVLEMSLVHELIHCRDLHPRSKMTKLIIALGIDPEKDPKVHVAMLEYPAYLRTIEILSKIKTNSMFAGMLRFNRGAVAYIASHLIINISSMSQSKQELARKYFKMRISRIDRDVKTRLRKRLAEGYYLNDRSLSLVGL